jgi:hypothetical protein
MFGSILSLIESLRRYADVDYWRTISGRKVGFIGAEGSGIPIVGPAEYVASGADNPLMASVLDQRAAGTFTGDALRKDNFPVSAVVFLDKFIGATPEAVDRAFADIAQSIAQTKGNPDYQWLTDDDDELPKVSMMRSKALRYMTQKAKADPSYASVLGSVVDHFDDPKGRASVVYAELGRAGVSGEYTDDDLSANLQSEDDELLADSARAIGMRGGDDATLAKTFRAKVREVLRDIYIGNQLVLRAGADTKGGYIEATRGMGSTYPDISESESVNLMNSARLNNAPVVIAGQRPVSGVAEGVESDFKGFSYVGVKVPIEATLSTYRGLRLQKIRKGGYIRSERESLIIGAASLRIEPDQLEYVPD